MDCFTNETNIMSAYKGRAEEFRLQKWQLKSTGEIIGLLSG